MPNLTGNGRGGSEICKSVGPELNFRVKSRLWEDRIFISDDNIPFCNEESHGCYEPGIALDPSRLCLISCSSSADCTDYAVWLSTCFASSDSSGGTATRSPSVVSDRRGSVKVQTSASAADCWPWLQCLTDTDSEHTGLSRTSESDLQRGPSAVQDSPRSQWDDRWSTGRPARCHPP